MRKHFSSYIEKIACEREDIIFITGDVGFNALENVRIKLGNRFINAGVAEQNMISMAAGMASEGFKVLCYSIAPFVVYRCLEQIRNDICFHNLPVYIVGNGGGYGYGIMGSTHHALEDIAVLSGLPNLTCYIPSFIEDVNSCLDDIFSNNKPSYLRLGLGKNKDSKLVSKDFGFASPKNNDPGLTIISQGPVSNNVIDALFENIFSEQIELFIVNKMPLLMLPDEIKRSVQLSKNILTIEEHVSVGGLGSSIALKTNEASLKLNKFKSLHAKGYPSMLYGNQNYHLEESGLSSHQISETINSFFK